MATSVRLTYNIESINEWTRSELKRGHTVVVGALKLKLVGSG